MRILITINNSYNHLRLKIEKGKMVFVRGFVGWGWG